MTSIVKASPDRLAAVAALVDAARVVAPDLEKHLTEAFPGLAVSANEMVESVRSFLGVSSPPGLGGGGVAVWRDVGLFAVRSDRPPSLWLDGGEALSMAGVPGTSFWFRVEPVEQGRLHTFRFGVDGKCGVGADFAGYTERSYEIVGAPRGSLSEKRTVASQIYPGASTDYWLYVNHGVDEVRGAPVMVWHDGPVCLEPTDLHLLRMQIVTDNLVHLGLIPSLVHVLVAPSVSGDEVRQYAADEQPGKMRSLQYDTVSDRYGRYLVDEVLADVERVTKLRSDAYSRGSAGWSSGGICAFTLGWFQPDQFSRVHSVIGSYTGLQWDPESDLTGGFMLSNLIRREPKRNIRVWLSDGSNDLEIGPNGDPRLYLAGSWPLNNIMLANALKLSGYDFHFRFGEGYHGGGQAGLDLPESLAWLWRDYDADRTEQTYEQDPAEREQPVFRVRIANRDT